MILGVQGEQSTWAKLSAIKSNCGIEVCLDKCLRELEHQGRLAREEEAKKRREAGLAPSKIAEEGAEATGDTSEGDPAVMHMQSRHGLNTSPLAKSVTTLLALVSNPDLIDGQQTHHCAHAVTLPLYHLQDLSVV